MKLEKGAPDVVPSKHRLYVHVYPAAEETETEEGIIIPQRAREAEIDCGIRAQILRVGKLCDSDYKPGQWILIPRWTGTAITHDNLGDPDMNYAIIMEDCVICQIDAETAKKQIKVITRQKRAAV